jgi:hypothetical protein
MIATNHNGSRRDVLLLLDSPNYVEALSSALAGAGTLISTGDVYRPMGAADDMEYELPEFSREYLDGRFEYRQIAEPAWWIVKRNAGVRTPNFDLISTATICGMSGVLLVEAKAHHGELETCGKSFKSSSSLENHQKIGASIELANRALNAIAPGFKLNRDAFYQVSNRIAWGWRLASLGVPVTVLYLGFVQDPFWPKDQFESNEDWMRAARSYLGNVVPVDVLGRRLQCSERGSLLISAAALPATPPAQ